MMKEEQLPPFIRWAESEEQLRICAAQASSSSPFAIVISFPIAEALLRQLIGNAPFEIISVSPGEGIPIRPGCVYFNTDDHALICSGNWLFAFRLGQGKNSLEEMLAQNSALEKRATELVETNEELERFAYVASHDLQEPLRMVSSFLQLLKKKYGDQLDETALQYVNYAVDGADRMKKLIMDLLDYSRAGGTNEDHTQVDMNMLLFDVLSMLSNTIQSTNAQIDAGNLPVVHGRKTQLLQLLQNLVGNALKYRSRETPRVEIGCTDKGSAWEFFVKDNGIGIDPKFNEKIFLIFQRLHGKSEYSGNGIGLAICRKIVERHGGKIWVESEPGKGSTFKFTLAKS